MHDGGAYLLRMAKVIYVTNTSLDGYIEDETGAFNWVDPQPVFDCVTELLKPVRTYLLGRRLYETMAFWDAPVEEYPVEHREFARVWQRIDKIVFSRTLPKPTSGNVRVDRKFDPEAIRILKRESEYDINIGGAELAGQAFDEDLIDECHVFANPVIVGGGKPGFRTISRSNLELLGVRSFSSGVVHLHYRIRRKRV